LSILTEHCVLQPVKRALLFCHRKSVIVYDYGGINNELGPTLSEKWSPAYKNLELS